MLTLDRISDKNLQKILKDKGIKSEMARARDFEHDFKLGETNLNGKEPNEYQIKGLLEILSLFDDLDIN